MSQDNQKRDAHCANQRGDAEDVAHGLSPHACTHAWLPSTGLRRTLDLRREKVAALPVSVSPGTHGSSRDATYRSPRRFCCRWRSRCNWTTPSAVTCSSKRARRLRTTPVARPANGCCYALKPGARRNPQPSRISSRFQGWSCRGIIELKCLMNRPGRGPAWRNGT